MVARTCLPAAPPATIDVPVGHAGILARRRDLWRAPGTLSHISARTASCRPEIPDRIAELSFFTKPSA
jgi:hypothetical protein